MRLARSIAFCARCQAASVSLVDCSDMRPGNVAPGKWMLCAGCEDEVLMGHHEPCSCAVCARKRGTADVIRLLVN